MNKSVLIIDDNLTICLMLKSWLQKKNFNVEIVNSVDQAKQLIIENPFDLILTDIRMPGDDGFALLSWVKRYDSDIVVIMMTGFADIESAVESMKAGAADYISKPIDPEVLFKKIDEAFITQENISKTSEFSNSFIKPPGESYKNLFNQLNQAAVNNDHRLIIGDRGTGKSSAVKYIYEKGVHPSNPLVIFDSSQTDSSLMGKLKLASGGLLHIKELDQLNLSMQDELLSILTRQTVSDNYTRVILSSEKNPEELKSVLIPKLYHLLEKDTITLPALKGEKEVIQFLTLHFLKFANDTLKREVTKIDRGLQEALIEYEWPSNIQELKNCIIKAVLLTEGSRLRADIIPSLFNNKKPMNKENPVTVETIRGLRKENYEKEKIKQALELAKGNKTMAASILNIDRKTLYNKIKLYDVSLQ